MRRFKALVTTGLMATTVVTGLIMSLTPIYVSAMADANLGQKSPFPSNSEPDGAHVHFIRRQGQFAGIQPDVSLRAYYDASTTPSQWGNYYLQLSPGAGDDINAPNVCDTAGNAGDQRFIVITLSTNTDSKTFNISKDQVCKERDYTAPRDLNDPGAPPNNNVFYGSYPLPSFAGIDAATNMRIVRIDISYGNNVPNNDANGIRFVVKGPVGNPDIGEEGSLNDSRTFSVLANWDLHNFPNNATKLAVPFGADCNTNNPDVQDAHVRIYDADNGLGFDDTVRFKVKNIDTGDYVSFSGKGSTGNNGSGQLSDDATGNNTIYTPPPGSGSATQTSYAQMPHFKVGVHYQLEVYGLDPRNTIALGLPGDAIFGVINCNTLNPSVTCTINVDSPIAAGDAENVTVTARTSGYGGSPPNRMTLKITSPGSQTASPAGGPSYSAPFNLGAFGIGEHTVTATATDPGDSTIKDTCSNSFTVIAKPYVSVYGGDAAAGVSPKYDGSVYGAYTNAAEPGGFVGWNDGSGGSWGSAGAQWAVQALGNIIGFASGRGVTTGVPQYLSFTNTAIGPGNNYGGNFDGTGNVKLDYSGDISKAAAGDVYNSDKVLAGGAVGTQTVVVKDGDAFIASSQQYGSTTWATPKDIPSYKLIVVGGDIYVGRDVTQLDGTYVAIPKVVGGVTKGGNIYTCSAELTPTSFVRYDPTDPLWSLIKGVQYSLCSKQLKVFGSLVAKQVHFDRTFGSYVNQTTPYSTTGAAESIIYGPEMWLSSVPGGSGNYSAITGLPPIL